MTVSAVATPVSYLADGSHATYVFPWKVVNLVDLIVQITVPGSNPVTQSSNTYTVAGLGNPVGGTVTFNAGNVTAGYTVTLFLNPQEVQNTDLQNQGSYNPSLVEGALDQLTRMVQSLQDQVNLCIRGQLTDTANMQLPAAVLRASKYPVFDPLGAISLSSQAPGVTSATSVLNVTALKNVPTPLTSTVYATTGYYTGGDGGSGLYYWNSTDTRADNGGTIIQLTGGGTGRFNLLAPAGVYNVQQFGAKGDGATDDTTAIQNAINQVTIGTTPGTVYFAPRRYMTSGITITAPNNNNNTSGQLSLTIVGYGATLAGTIAATTVLGISPAQSPLTFANGIVVLGLTIDMANMSNVSTNYGIYLTNTYNDLFQSVVVINQPASAFSLFIQYRAYTNTFQRCQFGNVKLAGNILNSDAITTQKFSQCSASQFAVDKSWGIDFDACVVLSASGSKYLLSNCFTINIHNGDIEGAAGTYLDLTGGSVSYLISTGNNVSSSLTYISGTGTAVRLDDKKRGPFANPYGAPNTNYASAGPNTIWTYDGDSSGGTLSSSLVMVSGDDGTRGFIDLLFVAYGVVFVVASNNQYGTTQPTRTYAMSGTNLQLTRSSTNCGNIKVALLDNPQ